MPSITAEAICVDFPILSAWSRSLRNIAFARALKTGAGAIHQAETMKIVRALDHVSFTLRDGDKLGLLGNNGAGKTTLIRALAGIYEPVAGRLQVEGRQIPMFDIGLGLDDDATGYENIYIRGLIMGLSVREVGRRMEEIAEFSELGVYLNFPIRTYSAGMKMRLMFAIATSVEGDIVLLDEWIAVGDAGFRKKTNDRLRAITARSGIVIVASHDLGLLCDVCTLGLHLDSGRVLHFGPIEEVFAAMAAPSPPAAPVEAPQAEAPV